LSTIRWSASVIFVLVAVVAGLVLASQAGAQTPTVGEPTEGEPTVPADATATEGDQPVGTPPTAGDEVTPGDGPTPGGQPTGDAPLVFVVVPDEEFEDGDTFDAEVRVEGAESVAAFEFDLSFDPDHLSVVDQDAATEGVQFGTAIGEFLTQGERENIQCNIPQVVSENQASVVCVTNDFPVCQGGPPGASGSGTLGTIQFEITAGGDTDLELPPDSAKLVLDDFEPCSEEGRPVEVVPATQGATVNVKSESDYTLWIILGIAAIVIAIVAGGAFAYFRTRQGPAGEA
jgi:Cohesin domain